MYLPWITAGGAFAVGFLSLFSARWFYLSGLSKHAKVKASEIIGEAKQEANERLDEAKAIANEAEEGIRKNFEKDLLKLEQNIKKLEEQVSLKEASLQKELQKKYDVYSREKGSLGSSSEKVQLKQRRLSQKQERLEDVKNNFVARLLDKTNQKKEDVVAEITKKLCSKAQVEANKWIAENEEETRQDSERRAKLILNTALNRFARPYCAERGLGYISFTKPEVATRVIGPDRSHLPLIEKICGVDLIYDEKNMNLSVSGFDPVRRELARAAIEKMMHDKNLNEGRIDSLVQKTKKELFKKIRISGDRFAKELGVQSLSAEIKNTIGALMYRYSFSQNQYYHCAEVGHLCGLLSAELNLSIENGKRAGCLHDIGKAMDHSIDGGHAVIGADFIEKNGESEEIVHAVRAHHYDVRPSTELAHLVIAADAISGARPGARRSTANSYMQKMEGLEQVANSFQLVKDTLILNAGREVRVYVDGKKVDDYKSVDLSKEIAKKIQEECAYPGTIKVTVVRETQAVDYAK